MIMIVINTKIAKNRLYLLLKHNLYKLFMKCYKEN